MRSVFYEIRRYIVYTISNLPGLIGIKVRNIYYSRRFRFCGNELKILNRVTIYKPENISIGERCGINSNVWINGSGGISIGDDVLIGPNVLIHSANHNFDRIDTPINLQGWTFKAVTIEDNVWIGANAIILPGIHIGTGSVIGAGSVVTKNIPPFSVALGNPAKVVKKRVNN